MHRLISWVAIVAALLFSHAPANAAFRFGTDESIHFIQDVGVKGPNNEALYLGRLLRTKSFIAGYSFEDAGFVLGVKGEGKKFYDMPTGEKLAGFQKSGLLPDPLPDYAPNFFDYFFGYSLYWVAAFVVLWMLFDAWRKKRKAAQSGEAAQPPATTPQ